MNLTGHQLIGPRESGAASETFAARNPAADEDLSPLFHEAALAEIDEAAKLAAGAFDAFRRISPGVRADFLEAIAEETLALGDELLERAAAETAHPLARCAAERERVLVHTRQFAAWIREGSWTDARIDHGDPERQPLPKPDVRSLLEPVGPVAVFGASNFPIAISVLGTDTVSAFAAGCPVVVKAHPAHPGTCEIAARAVRKAIVRTGMPEGIFSMVHGRSHEVGARLVAHPRIAAAAFTGSLAGGRALFEVANSRPCPIPFYAEMGSVNPVFLLPGALRARAEGIAKGFVGALTAGVGQFCTNPGLVLGMEGEDWSRFRSLAGTGVAAYDPATMLHAGIHGAYAAGIAERLGRSGLELVGQSTAAAGRGEAAAYLFATTQEGLLADPTLYEELFGPVSTLVTCAGPEEFVEVAERLEGSLSASVHGTEEDLAEHRDLVEVLRRKVGRLIFNGYPVGLEICHSIHHGGPYPATTHAHFTSIGTRAIHRFARPVCYQDWPDSLLPPQLQESNPLGILRLVDGERRR